MRDIPLVNETKCVGSATCVAVCPTSCLAMSGATPWLIRPADCISCAACAAVCPVTAIEMKPLPTP